MLGAMWRRDLGEMRHGNHAKWQALAALVVVVAALVVVVAIAIAVVVLNCVCVCVEERGVRSVGTSTVACIVAYTYLVTF